MAGKEFDLIVVGGGPAGLQAALTSSYLKLSTLVIEASLAGGALANIYPWKHVDEYLGFPGKAGAQVAKRMAEHVKSEGAVVHENEEVLEVSAKGDTIKLTSTKSRYKCKALIIAVGKTFPRKLGVEGEELTGVYHSLADPASFKLKKVLVVGGGDTAVESAVMLAREGADVTLAHRRDQFRASEKNLGTLRSSKVNVLYQTELMKVVGGKEVASAVLKSMVEGEESDLLLDAVLISVGTTSNKEFLEKAGVKLSEEGNVITDELARTNLQGVFAAGDVVGKWMRIPEALGEGGFAALNAFKFIKNPYWS